MRAALTLLCGFSYGQAWAIDLPYAALLSLRFWPGDRPSAQITGLVT
jgi:alpha-ribazole phosphatase